VGGGKEGSTAQAKKALPSLKGERSHEGVVKGGVRGSVGKVIIHTWIFTGASIGAAREEGGKLTLSSSPLSATCCGEAEQYGPVG